MEYAAFLNSSGGIVTYYDRQYQLNLKVAPYVETVTLPVVSVDSAALYGGHPENLATLTYTSGAALTFFCDSVAGGDDSSGDGSFDNPWRSLKTASRFLNCNQCVLSAGAEYIQLKVKGTVNYSASLTPFNPSWYGKLIIAGWGERCDLTSCAGGSVHLRDVRAGSGLHHISTASGCYLENCRNVNGAFVDCEVKSVTAAVAYDCSGNNDYTPPGYSAMLISAGVIYGGAYSNTVGGHPAFTAQYLYGGRFVASADSCIALSVGVAAAGATVSAVGGSSALAAETNIYGVFLRDCNFSATASRVSSAFAAAIYARQGLVVQGGAFYASASAWGNSSALNASAGAFIVEGATTTPVVSGAMVFAAASAHVDQAGFNSGWYRATVTEDQEERNFVSGCRVSRTWLWDISGDSSSLYSHTVTSSGACVSGGLVN